MVGAVVAAIVVTVLLPDELRLGPSWLLHRTGRERVHLAVAEPL
jgi:hypothetical protein